MSQLLKFGAFDADTAAAEKEDLDSAGGDMMKLVQGRNVVRVLPPPVGSRSPFKTVFQHFVEMPGNKKSFICARLEAKRPCAVCRKIDELKQSASKVDRDAGDDMFARRRIFLNVIDRKAPEKGPMVLAVGKQVHEQLLSLRDEETGGDYCDPISGFDVIIERTGAGKNDTKYKVYLSRKSTPLAGTADAPDIERMQEWIDCQNDLSKFARLPDQDEVAGILDGDGEPAQPQTQQRRRISAPVQDSPRAESTRAPARTTARRAPARSAEDDVIDVED